MNCSSRTFTLRLLALAVTAAFCIASSPAVAEQVDWTIKGRFLARHQLPELGYKGGDEGIPIHGIKVKVSAKEKGIGIWNEWGEVKTGSEGRFTLKMTKDRTDRAFKIEFKFQDDDLLEIRHSNSTNSLTKVKWYTAYKQDEWQAPGTIDLGDFVFRENGHEDMGDWEVRRHADIWVAARLAIDYLDGFGSAYGFPHQVKIKYPHDGKVADWFEDARDLWGVFTGKTYPDIIEASYANPVTNVIYLLRTGGANDAFDAPTIYHEMMHVWAYQHVGDPGGKTELTTAVLDGNTHGFSNYKVAFHEGFAEYAAHNLLAAIYPKYEGPYSVGPDDAPSGTEGVDYYVSRLPYNRPCLNSGVGVPGASGTNKIPTLAKMETHDAGWWSALNILSGPAGLAKYKFTKPSSGDPNFIWCAFGAATYSACKAPVLSFKDVLHAFDSRSSAGYPADLTTSDMTIEAFIARACAINGLSTTEATRFKRLADPAESIQPYQMWCE